MLGSIRASRPRRKILLKDMNASIKCSQCSGYLIDATALVDCLHTFCRACILKHFEASGKACPTCNWDYRKRSYSILRPDVQLQTLVYKMVGGLHSKEKQRREEFYSSTGVRASSSCSDDSVLEDIPDHEPFISSTDSIDFFSPEDSISLSLEYYQNHLDTSSSTAKEVKRKDNSSLKSDPIKDNTKENDNSESNSDKDSAADKPRDRRYLQCPAAVEMTHLQKFVRMKYGLSNEHKVDIIYQGEVLPSYLNLMDVAYSFDWSKVKPMRFFYRIFALMKVQPIKIINTTSALGSKQLQIVTAEAPPPKSPPKEVPKSPVVSPTVKPAPELSPQKKEEPIKKKLIETEPCTQPKSPEDNSRSNTSKERLMAQLQLQPNRDVNGKRLVEPRKTPERSPEGCFLRELPEQDKEEIKRFAEKRDREWRMLAEKEKDDTNQPHNNKKRKKSKHSKSDVTHKKRKIHAEITPSDEKPDSMKLKLKVTQMNGHKHKHRSGSTSSTVEEAPPQPQAATKSTSDSSKQELLKLRGVRHKNISLEAAGPKPAADEGKKLAQEPAETPAVSTKLRSDFTYNKNQQSNKEVSEQHEKQTFLKTFQSYTKEHGSSKPAEKIAPLVETEKVPLSNHKVVNTNNNLNSTINNHKLMERKLAILKQECTIETKRNFVVVNKPDRKVTFGSTEKLKIQSEKPKIISSQFTTNPGFTVSKVDQGVKRKMDKPAQITDHRPSLEITAIPSPAPQPIFTKGNLSLCQQQPATKRSIAAAATKRPPPDTIPLERIIKSNAAAMNKAGVSITPSKPSSDPSSTGVLDLSQKLTTIELAKGNNNGVKVNKVISDNKGLSNLQMLSKVATEQVFSKPPPKLIRPQIPNLQSIHSFQPKPMPNLTKIPKLNEMTPQFRNAQAMRAAMVQNQSIRNIPNPSLLVRQQQQNRLNADKVVKPLVLNNGAKSVVVIEAKERLGESAVGSKS